MSAIYAISGNVAQALNEYGINLAEEDIEDEDTGEVFTNIRVSRKELTQKKENIRWNQIMKYFEGMQQHKIEIEQDEDPTKVKLMSGILNKVLDKIPKV
jgi:vacuolar-type H+-ATPase subunit I/STV1